MISGRMGKRSTYITPSLFSVTLILLLTSVKATNFKQTAWHLAFSTDFVPAGYVAVLDRVSSAICAHRCFEELSCESFAYNDIRATCWLYTYLTDYMQSGASFPGTRFYWPVRADCPLPYTLTSGVCYWAPVGQDMTWFQARDFCKQNGGHLFIANTLEKLRVLQALPISYYSLGGEDYNAEGNWRWLNGETVIVGWGTSEPNGSTDDSDCVYYNNYRVLDDYKCNITVPFVCEIPYKNL